MAVDSGKTKPSNCSSPAPTEAKKSTSSNSAASPRGNSSADAHSNPKEVSAQTAERAPSCGRDRASDATSSGNSSSGSGRATPAGRVMLQWWLDESPHEGPYTALETTDCAGVFSSGNAEEEAETSSIDLEH